MVSRVALALGGTDDAVSQSARTGQESLPRKKLLTIVRRDSPPRLVGTLLGVLALPQGPHPINHAVVEEECRVAWARILVSHYAANPEVAGGMHSVQRFELEIKRLEVAVCGDEVHHVCGLGVLGPLGRDVTDQAARVVVEPVVLAGGQQRHRAEVDGQVGKGAGLDAAAAGARVEQAGGAQGGVVDGAVGDCLAVAAHRVWRAVEDGRLAPVLPRLSPVPVRLCTLVAGLVAQSKLVEVGKVAVPRKKQTLKDTV